MDETVRADIIEKLQAEEPNDLTVLVLVCAFF